MDNGIDLGDMSGTIAMYKDGQFAGVPFSAVTIAKLSGVQLSTVVFVLHNLVKADVLTVVGVEDSEERYSFVADNAAAEEEPEWFVPQDRAKAPVGIGSGATLSIISADDQHMLYLNQHAVKMHADHYERLSVGFFKNRDEIVIAATTSGTYLPQIIHSTKDKSVIVGYRINNNELLSLLAASGCQMNVKVPVEFDPDKLWWRGQLAAAVSLRKRSKKAG